MKHTAYWFRFESPGEARTNPRSFWDTLHPGRPRAANYLCNRLLTRNEIELRVNEGITVSLMAPGTDRDQALAQLRGRRYQAIWSLPTKKEKDKRPIVYRPDAFIEENTAFDVSAESETWRAAQTTSVVTGSDIEDFDDEDD